MIRNSNGPVHRFIKICNSKVSKNYIINKIGPLNGSADRSVGSCARNSHCRVFPQYICKQTLYGAATFAQAPFAKGEYCPR